MQSHFSVEIVESIVLEVNLNFLNMLTIYV